MGDKDKLDDLNFEDEAELNESEEAEEGGAEKKPAEKKAIKGLSSGIVRILLYIIGIIILIAISVTISYLVASKTAEKPDKISIEQTYKNVTPPYDTLRLADFTINTADIDEQHVIRVTIALAYTQKDAAVSAELAQREAQIRDIINRILSSKRKDEIDSIDGKENLKNEIKNAINNILVNGKIKDVYFIDFFIS
ncbi:MAG: flagellar basal body-associated FliL family protein [Spirochaetota bacterium]